jgi:hypothetical protein
VYHLSRLPRTFGDNEGEVAAERLRESDMSDEAPAEERPWTGDCPVDELVRQRDDGGTLRRLPTAFTEIIRSH